jgi:serine phosphatase RsbU (regulator of sigma subunit)
VAVTTDAATQSRGETLAALAELSHALASGLAQPEALDRAARAAVAATGADAALVRVAEDDRLVARAVAAGSGSLIAELHGTSIALDGLPADPADERAELPAGIRSAIERTGADAVFLVPVVQDGHTWGSLELYRRGEAFDRVERLAAGLVADHVALALRVHGAGSANGSSADPLEIAGDALAAATDGERPADRIARLAARAAGAESAWLWRTGPDGLQLVAGLGEGRPPAERTAVEIVADPRSHAVEVVGRQAVATVQLGEPPLGALQLRFSHETAPSDQTLARIDRFAVRAAHALRAGERAREVGGELERSRALLEVLGQAISELSLAHTLETAAARVADLLGAGRVEVYLVEDGHIASGGGLAVPPAEAAVAGRLLELALGPEHGRSPLVVPAARSDHRLAGHDAQLAESGIEAAVALPLVVGGGAVTGLLAAYPPLGRVPDESEAALLVALAAQLAVVVQNARLHEQATALGVELEQALGAERASARRLGALYEISRSFAQSMSLETTLDAVAKMVAESLGVDAAGIRLPDGRGAELHLRALHVCEPRLAEVARTVLARPQPLTSPVRRVLRTQRPLILTAEQAPALGGAYALLTPFLAKGSTAAVLPIATPTEVLGTMTIVSFEAGRPIDSQTVDAALSIAGQAALALDNARLYQQQKEFADTMQRSLLPQIAPAIAGLDVGAVYDSAATVDVGGDVYDFLTLGDGRLAVVLGDVTGHGVEATADMAMAKYVFRSLAREHTDPGAFLAAANDVVAGEIAPGKFITMVEVVADAGHDRLACACAGHPAPRLVRPDGSVEALPVRGLALGIDEGQEYETAEVAFPPGSAVVVFTDGVIEARRGGELFGLERLDEVLAEMHDRPADEIADAVRTACRRFAGGELTDDCAVVVIARR